MKKLLLLLLLIPNLVMGETWVCSNINEDGEIVTSTYTRKGDKFIIGNSEDRIYFEDSSSITLTFTHGAFGFNTTILDKANKTFFATAIIKTNGRYGVVERQGKCEVIE